MLSRLVAGDSAPILKYKAAKDAPFAYILDSCQFLPEERLNTLDRRPDDLITGIELTITYLEGKSNKVERLANMLRIDFEVWCNELSERGLPMVGFMRTRLLGD